jgi:manganese efflux pump family protein
VRIATRTGGVAGGVLLAFFAAGCGAPAGHAHVTADRTSTVAAHTTSSRNVGGGAPQATVQGCTAYGVYAIEHRITVTRTPSACQGLSRAEINQAAARAIIQAAGGVRKAVWRKRAAEVAPFLRHLFTAPAPVTSSLPAMASGSGSGEPLGRKDLGMDIAALIAWLITAGSGGYLLGNWLAHGGTLRSRADGTGSPPAVIIGHFGLALTGLVIWVIYLVAGWSALAWTAVGVLLPVAGLGMAALTVGLPGLPSLPALQGRPGRPVPAIAGSAAAGSAPAGSSAADGAAAPAVADAPAVPGAPAGAGSSPIAVTPTGADAPGRAVSAKRRLSPLIVVGHGALAVTTMLLVLLAALGVAAG